MDEALLWMRPCCMAIYVAMSHVVVCLEFRCVAGHLAIGLS
jgi:hypothetical protein